MQSIWYQILVIAGVTTITSALGTVIVTLMRSAKNRDPKKSGFDITIGD